MNTKATRSPWIEAGLWMLFLGPFFFAVYGACNWITSLRPDVGVFYFSWEKWIPFIPVLIIPYMSIDLFFAGSTFLCRNKTEIHTLIARIVFAIAVSAICFLLFPLRFGFPRPETAGWVGKIFDALYAFDQPFNLAPSLHISLRSLLWPVYGRRTKGWFRSILKIWFVLMGVSTVFVYQHHIVDVIAGHTVALLCFYLFPAKSERCVPARNRKVALLYVFGALVSAALTLHVGFGFIWPTVAFSLMSGAYLGLGAQVFRKNGGCIPLHVRCLLLPYFVGSQFSFMRFIRNQPSWSRVCDELIIGRRLSAHEAVQLKRLGVVAVLDLTAEFSETKPLLELHYRNIPVLDLTCPTAKQLHDALRFIEAHRASGPVYVHCALGLGRSACVAAAYLLREGKVADEKAAIKAIREARVGVVLNKEAEAVLAGFRRNVIERTPEFGTNAVVSCS